MDTHGEGYFPRGRSMLRRVHELRVVGLHYGQRALLMQATDALAFTGLMANTTGLPAPFKRLAQTAKTMESIYFGSRATADREAQRVRTLHGRVRGRLSEPTGPWPAGSEYAANDPKLLLWILACLADSAITIYERFVAELHTYEREAYWRDYLLVGELFGLAREDAPSSYTEFHSYMHERLASDNLYVTESAREVGLKVAFELPMPLYGRPSLAVSNSIVLGLLPERVRELYGLEWSAARRLAVDALARWSRSAGRLVPASMRRGSCAGAYDLIANTEARRLEKAATAVPSTIGG